MLGRDLLSLIIGVASDWYINQIGELNMRLCEESIFLKIWAGSGYYYAGKSPCSDLPV